MSWFLEGWVFGWCRVWIENETEWVARGAERTAVLRGRRGAAVAPAPPFLSGAVPKPAGGGGPVAGLAGARVPAPGLPGLRLVAGVAVWNRSQPVPGAAARAGAAALIAGLGAGGGLVGAGLAVRGRHRTAGPGGAAVRRGGGGAGAGVPSRAAGEVPPRRAPV